MTDKIISSKMCPGTANHPAHLLDASTVNFSSNRSRLDGLSVYCRECAAERQRLWKEANQSKVKAARKEYYHRTHK